MPEGRRSSGHRAADRFSRTLRGRPIRESPDHQAGDRNHGVLRRLRFRPSRHLSKESVSISSAWRAARPKEHATGLWASWRCDVSGRVIQSNGPLQYALADGMNVRDNRVRNIRRDGTLRPAKTFWSSGAKPLEHLARQRGLLEPDEAISRNSPFQDAKRALGIVSIRRGFGRGGRHEWMLLPPAWSRGSFP